MKKYYVSFLTQRFAVKSSPTRLEKDSRLELRARSELDLRIVVGAVSFLTQSLSKLSY